MRELCTTLTNGCNILCREVENGENTLKPRRIFRVSFMRRRRFTQVVAQGRRGRSLQRLGEYRFRPILFKPWSGVEPVEL
jgi:hypothetical protein